MSGKKLLLIAKNFLPDIIYTNTSVLSLGYDLSKKIKKPHVWHIREYGDKDFNISYFPSRNAIVNKIKKSNVSIFTTMLLKEHWLGQKRINSEVIYNGVLEHKHVFLKERNSSIITIGIVGVVLSIKKQDFAIQVFKECYEKNNNLRLNIYGEILDHKFYMSLLEDIEANNLSDVVKFLGYIPNNHIYKEIDILLSCCLDEAFGRTLIEAMSYKIPVLASNSGGPSEILRDNYDLSLYNSIDEAIIKMNCLINKSNLHKKSSDKGYELAMRFFTKEDYLKKIAAVFKKVINE